MKTTSKWPVGTRPPRSEAVALDEAHVGRQVLRHVPDIRRPLLSGRDVADEVAAIAGEVEHRARRVDLALQEAADLAPHQVLRPGLGVAEPVAVDVLEIHVRHVRRGRLAGAHGPTPFSTAASMRSGVPCVTGRR